MQDILIITDSGKVIASKINNQHIEEHLFGLFISALSSFVEKISGEGLRNLEFTNLFN